jgi:hypothetical protein
VAHPASPSPSLTASEEGLPIFAKRSLGRFAAQLDGDVGLRSQPYDLVGDVPCAQTACGILLGQALRLHADADDFVHQTRLNNEERDLLVNSTLLGCCNVRHAQILEARCGLRKPLGCCPLWIMGAAPRPERPALGRELRHRHAHHCRDLRDDLDSYMLRSQRVRLTYT